MNIEHRTKLVSQLVNYEGDPQHLVNELRTYGWDCDTDLVEIQKEHIEKVLNLYLNNKIQAKDLNIWAECLERREDIGFEKAHKKVIDESIFWLANPEINYEITSDLAKKIIDNLENNVIN